MDRHPWVKPYTQVVEEQFQLDDNAQQAFNSLFDRVGKLADTCTDQASFSKQFIESPLYEEYMGLFQKYSSQSVAMGGKTPEDLKKEVAKETIKSMPAMIAQNFALRQVNRIITRMLPDEINRLRWTGARGLPIIGPIIQRIDEVRWISRLIGKGKEQTDENQFAAKPNDLHPNNASKDNSTLSENAKDRTAKNTDQ